MGLILHGAIFGVDATTEDDETAIIPLFHTGLSWDSSVTLGSAHPIDPIAFSRFTVYHATVYGNSDLGDRVTHYTQNVVRDVRTRFV